MTKCEMILLNKPLLRAVIFSLAFSVLFLSSGLLYSGEWIVKHQINSPTNESYGLAWDGSNLWLSGSTNMIYKINPVNGNVITQFQINLQSQAEDLAWDGEYLWVCDKMANVNPKLIHKIDVAMMQIIESVEVDATAISDLNGLTFCDGQLVVGDSQGRLYFINPENGYLENTLNLSPEIEIGTDGLAWDDIHLWLSHNNGSIYQLDKNTGNIVDRFGAPGGLGNGPEGLTWDGSSIWFVDNTVDKIYQLEFSDQKIWGSLESLSVHDIIICSFNTPNRTLHFNTSDFNTIDSAKLAFGYINFDWLVQDYPEYITQEHVNFIVSINQTVVYQKSNVTDDKTKYAEIDVLSFLNNSSVLEVTFTNTYPDDALGIVQPVLLITGNKQANGINENGFYQLKPGNIVLEQNVPNPFSETTEIGFQLKNDGHVKVAIFTVEGTGITTLLDEYKHAGDYTVYWNGKGKTGKKIEPGTYLYSVIFNEEIATKRLLISK